MQTFCDWNHWLDFLFAHSLVYIYLHICICGKKLFSSIWISDPFSKFWLTSFSCLFLLLMPLHTYMCVSVCCVLDSFVYCLSRSDVFQLLSPGWVALSCLQFALCTCTWAWPHCQNPEPCLELVSHQAWPYWICLYCIIVSCYIEDLKHVCMFFVALKFGLALACTWCIWTWTL